MLQCPPALNFRNDGIKGLYVCMAVAESTTPWRTGGQDPSASRHSRTRLYNAASCVFESALHESYITKLANNYSYSSGYVSQQNAEVCPVPQRTCNIRAVENTAIHYLKFGYVANLRIFSW